MSTPDQLQQENPHYAALIAGFEFRRPVTEESPINSGVEQQWRHITEVARQSILANVQIREAAAILVTTPVAEALPAEALDRFAEKDERTAAMLKSIEGELGKVLGLPSVPTEAVQPDLRSATYLYSREDALRELDGVEKRARDPKELETDTERVMQSIDRRLKKGGITRGEQELIAARYRYARDVKLLALTGELHDNPFTSHITSGGILVHELPSGTRLGITEEAFAKTPDILDPSKWKGRRKIKDRVHEVLIGDNKYILKERKTPFHTDLKKNGHKDGLTSAEEVATAKQFSELGEISTGPIRLHWEKPLGFVEFPDGYQFAVFENEPGLQTDTQAVNVMIQRAILEKPEVYADEYQKLRDQARNLLAERPDLATAEEDEVPKPKRIAISKSTRRYRKEYAERPKRDELTYEEFAAVKAESLTDNSRDLLRKITLEQGYVNSDLDGFGFRVHETDQGVSLEMIAFDFEYYRKNTQWAQDQLYRFRQAKEEKDADGYGYRTTPVVGQRPVHQMAIYAELQQKGYRLPAVKEWNLPENRP